MASGHCQRLVATLWRGNKKDEEKNLSQLITSPSEGAREVHFHPMEHYQQAE